VVALKELRKYRGANESSGADQGDFHRSLSGNEPIETVHASQWADKRGKIAYILKPG
jgi:hypothetical protein